MMFHNSFEWVASVPEEGIEARPSYVQYINFNRSTGPQSFTRITVYCVLAT